MATDGGRVIRFAEQFCRLTKGRNAGKRMRLFPFQHDILNELYATDDGGQRIYRRGLLGLPRKNGKSALGAVIALYSLFLDGEAGAEVYSVAGDKDQAKIVFKEARRMVELDPDLSGALTCYRDAIEHKPSGSVYQARAAEAYTAQGYNPYVVIFDEVHVQANQELWDAMSLGSATREWALILGITTAGWDMSTLCGHLYKLGKAGTPGMYFKWWEPNDYNCDWKDPAVWLETNPLLTSGVMSMTDFETAAQQTSENAFRRYRLNQWTSAVEAWLPHGAWGARADNEGTPNDGDVVYLGFDGSFSGDTTGIIGCTPEGHLFVVGAWERPAGPEGEGWRVDIADVEEAIRDACKRWEVPEVAMDPFRWSRTMQALEHEGIPVVEWPTTSVARMVPATARFFDAVMDGRLTHDGDGRLARHVANCRIKTDRLGPRIVKEHKMSTNRIDLAVAAVIAYDRATRPPEESPEPPSIY